MGPEDSKRGCSCFQIHPYVFAINAIKDQCFFQQFLLHKYSLCLFKGSIQNIAYAVLEAKEATHPYQSWQELFPGQFWNKFEYLYQEPLATAVSRELSRAYLPVDGFTCQAASSYLVCCIRDDAE